VAAALAAMRVRPRLLVVWVVFGILVAAAVVVELADRTTSSEATAERSADMLLAVPIADVGAIEVGHSGTLHRFERNRDGVWFYHGAHGNSEAAHEHQPDPAKADTIAKSLSGLTRARIERRLPPDAGGAKYGFASPRMLIVVYRVNEPRPFAQYAVGEVAPDSFSRYVQKAGSNEAVTIANYQIENLLKLVESMRN